MESIGNENGGLRAGFSDRGCLQSIQENPGLFFNWFLSAILSRCAFFAFTLIFHPGIVSVVD